ncbi:MAG: hypothetical protein J6T42_02195, partial [Clostridia bacterium]|nr:hypothetical protein [Clostridia bacterium]
MGVAVFFFGYVPIDPILLLIGQVLIGGILYLSLSILFRSEQLAFLWKKGRSFIVKRKEKADIDEQTDDEIEGASVRSDGSDETYGD